MRESKLKIFLAGSAPLGRACVRILILFTLVASISCGGGTYGTGTSTGERRFEGTVKSKDSETPLPNARVTLLDTGETAVTDARGFFAIDSTRIDSAVTFDLQVNDLHGTFSVENIADETRRVSVEVKFDPDTAATEALAFSARVWIIGDCDPYFDNGTTIEQLSPIETGTVCTVRLALYGAGQLRPDVPFAFQKRACGERAKWELVLEGVTGSGTNLGFAEFPFTFESAKRICEYRVVVPYRYKDYQELAYPIETLRQQNIEESGGKSS